LHPWAGGYCFESHGSALSARRSQRLDKSKCVNRAEFVIVDWSERVGPRTCIGALLLGYFDSDGRLLYAARVGAGMSVKTLGTLHATLKLL
jgi:bifunctional non-homologous end joining protein LigD